MKFIFYTIISLFFVLPAVGQSSHTCALGKIKSYQNVMKRTRAGAFDNNLMARYDVNWYFLDLNVERNSTVLSGNATIGATILAATDTFCFELNSTLTIDSVQLGGVNIPFTHTNNSHICYAQPNNTLMPNTDAKIKVYYHGDASVVGGSAIGEGHVSLDASIMNHKSECGSVAFLENIKNPIKVARAVMEQSPHVMLVGKGAQQFAVENGFAIYDPGLSTHAQKAYDDWLVKSEYRPIQNVEKDLIHKPVVPKKIKGGKFNHDTIGMIALDANGNLSGACTTSGMGFKMHGRVGDSPIIGAGLYVDNEIGAATATGHGEEVIRISGSFLVVEFMRQGYSPKMACQKAVERIIKKTPQKAGEIQVGFIAINKEGEHGGYAINPGFDYGLTTNRYKCKKIEPAFKLKKL